MNNKRLFQAAPLLAALSLSPFHTLIAAERASPIIVTATRTAQTADESLAAVTVITRQDIETSHSNTLMELLQNRTTGLDISRNGGPGSTTSLFLRGGESDHVLVLIDGVRVSSVTDGSFNWASLPPSQIERIEIVRGPNSTLYGSEAIGGVIQIFTRKGEGLHADLGGGSYGATRANIGSGGALGKAHVHINLNHEQAEGFSATVPESGRYEADNDGYRRDSITAGVSLPLNEAAQLSFNLLHSRGRGDYDDAGYADAHADSENSSAEIHLDWQTTQIWSQKLQLGSSQDTYESHDSWPAKIKTRRYSANWQHDLALDERSLLSLGVDAQQDNGEIVGSFDESISNHAAYLQYQWSGERYDLLLGGRSDHHSEYEQHSTGRITIGARFGAGRLYASYATAFKAPTFNELYYPFYGNPDIEPEESASREIGLRLGGLQLSAYDTRITNLIQSDPLTWQAVNTGRARLQGIELELRGRLGEWHFDSGITVQKAEDEKSGDALLRRAEKKLRLAAHGPVSPRANLGIELNYSGPRMDYGDVELGSYSVLNLTGDYRLDKQWTLAGRIENLLDETYQLADGYNTPGASAYLTLSYRQ